VDLVDRSEQSMCRRAVEIYYLVGIGMKTNSPSSLLFLYWYWYFVAVDVVVVVVFSFVFFFSTEYKLLVCTYIYIAARIVFFPTSNMPLRFWHFPTTNTQRERETKSMYLNNYHKKERKNY
jgi:hypothetical protein